MPSVTYTIDACGGVPDGLPRGSGRVEAARATWRRRAAEAIERFPDVGLTAVGQGFVLSRRQAREAGRGRGSGQT
jgi:hypothetical protein